MEGLRHAIQINQHHDIFPQVQKAKYELSTIYYSDHKEWKRCSFLISNIIPGWPENKSKFKKGMINKDHVGCRPTNEQILSDPWPQ